MMNSYKRRRSSLLNIIKGLDDSDVVSEDVVELDQVDESVPEKVDDDLTSEIDELEKEIDKVEQADECELPDDKDDDTIVSDEEIEEILNDLDEAEDATEEVAEEPVETASEENPGIEDEIQDTEGGGDPTTSEIAPGGEEAQKEVSTDAEVFPTESEYVASITKKFDRIASKLEKMGMKKLAFRLDVLSDKLEASIKK